MKPVAPVLLLCVAAALLAVLPPAHARSHGLRQQLLRARERSNAEAEQVTAVQPTYRRNDVTIGLEIEPRIAFDGKWAYGAFIAVIMKDGAPIGHIEGETGGKIEIQTLPMDRTELPDAKFVQLIALYAAACYKDALERWPDVNDSKARPKFSFTLKSLLACAASKITGTTAKMTFVFGSSTNTKAFNLREHFQNNDGYPTPEQYFNYSGANTLFYSTGLKPSKLHFQAPFIQVNAMVPLKKFYGTAGQQSPLLGSHSVKYEPGLLEAKKAALKAELDPTKILRFDPSDARIRKAFDYTDTYFRGIPLGYVLRDTKGALIGATAPATAISVTKDEPCGPFIHLLALENVLENHLVNVLKKDNYDKNDFHWLPKFTLTTADLLKLGCNTEQLRTLTKDRFMSLQAEKAPAGAAVPAREYHKENFEAKVADPKSVWMNWRGMSAHPARIIHEELYGVVEMRHQLNPIAYPYMFLADSKTAADGIFSPSTIPHVVDATTKHLDELLQFAADPSLTSTAAPAPVGPPAGGNKAAQQAAADHVKAAQKAAADKTG